MVNFMYPLYVPAVYAAAAVPAGSGVMSVAVNSVFGSSLTGAGTGWPGFDGGARLKAAPLLAS